MTKQERVLYVGCEGESTEPDYLDYLVKRFGSGERTGQPFRIVPVCKANGLVPELVVAAVREYAAADETWALFDRDEHTRIPQAVEDAAADGTEICFSHPSFDLWLLLHFQSYGGRQSGKKMQLPPRLVDLVLVHELTHLTVSAHGVAFRRRMRLVLEDLEELEHHFAQAESGLWRGAV